MARNHGAGQTALPGQQGAQKKQQDQGRQQQQKQQQQAKGQQEKQQQQQRAQQQRQEQASQQGQRPQGQQREVWLPHRARNWQSEHRDWQPGGSRDGPAHRGDLAPARRVTLASLQSI